MYVYIYIYWPNESTLIRTRSRSAHIFYMLMKLCKAFLHSESIQWHFASKLLPPSFMRNNLNCVANIIIGEALMNDFIFCTLKSR